MVRIPRLLPLFLLFALSAPAAAQEPPAQIYVFNMLTGEIALKIDDRPPTAVPAKRIQSLPITSGVHDLAVTLPDGGKITENHYFDPGASFATVKGVRWICLIIGVRDGEQAAELIRMQTSTCGQMIEAR